MILVAKVERTGSMVEKMVPQLPPERRNSVIAARMRTSDSARTSLKAASKLARLATSMTWAFFMLTREAMFNPVMFRRTFESPITEKSPDMMGVCVCRTPPEIGFGSVAKIFNLCRPRVILLYKVHDTHGHLRVSLLDKVLGLDSTK